MMGAALRSAMRPCEVARVPHVQFFEFTGEMESEGAKLVDVGAVDSVQESAADRVRLGSIVLCAGQVVENAG